MKRSLVSLAGLLLVFSAAGARAQENAFYKGKVVTVISGASGGYDEYTRLLAYYMGKYIPGNPGLIVRDMPGAASMASANYLYNAAPPDGLTFGSFVRAIPLAPLLGDKSAKYDPRGFTWIGSSSSYKNDAYLLVVRKQLGIKSIADLRSRREPLRLGSTGPSSEADVGAHVIGDVLGLKFKLVRGYPGTPNVVLAVEQGEMDGMMIGISSLHSDKPDWLKPNAPVRFLLQFGYGGDGRNPTFADVPRIDELARSDDDRAIFSLMQLPFKIARPFAGPPGISASKVLLLRQAFAKANQDPEYLSKAKSMGLDVSPVAGSEISELITKAAALPPRLLARYAALLENN
jgi:tripartite-type tricarboxylate transporter receptor subunit TctC